MRTEILYDDYLTANGVQKINKISIEISENIQLDLKYVEKNIQDLSFINKLCEIKMIDRIGVAELSGDLTRENIRELIELLKKIYMQM